MIKKIAVVGSGTMGHGIAESFAMYGYDVNLYDIDDTRLNAAMEEIREELDLLSEEEFIEPHVIEAALQRIKTFTDLKKSAADRDYVIEAVPEDLELKQRLLQELDGYSPQHAILASNTSSLKLNDMMVRLSDERKQRVMVNHWYNPAHLMPIVELSFFGNMPESIYEEVEQLYAGSGSKRSRSSKTCPVLWQTGFSKVSPGRLSRSSNRVSRRPKTWTRPLSSGRPSGTPQPDNWRWPTSAGWTFGVSLAITC